MRLARIEERDWNDAVSRNTVDAWGRFLTTHADSPRTREARDRLREIEGRETSHEKRTLTDADVQTREVEAFDPSRTIAAGSGRGEEKPMQLPHAPAQSEEAAWREAERAGRVAAWRRFIRDHGDSPRIAQAVRLLQEAEERESDETDWDTTRRLRTRAALQAYLAEHPFGRHVASARRALEKMEAEEMRAFREAGRAGTVQAWERFLDSYADGRLAADARTALEGARGREENSGSIVPSPGRAAPRPAASSRGEGTRGGSDLTAREVTASAEATLPESRDGSPKEATEWATVGPALKRLSKSFSDRISRHPIGVRARQLIATAIADARRRPRLYVGAAALAGAAIGLTSWIVLTNAGDDAPSEPPQRTGVAVLRSKRWLDGQRIYYGATTNFVLRNSVRFHDFLKRLGEDAKVWFVVDASAFEWVTAHPPAVYDATSTPWDEAFERVIRLNGLTYRVDGEKVVVSGPNAGLRDVIVYLPPDALPATVIQSFAPQNPQLTLPGTGERVRATFAAQCVVRRSGDAHCLPPRFVEGNSSDRAYVQAIAAVLPQWRFEPARVKGNPVDSLLTVRFTFPEFGPVGLVTSYEPW